MQSESQSQYFQGRLHTEDAQKVRLRFFLPIKKKKQKNSGINRRAHSLLPAPCHLTSDTLDAFICLKNCERLNPRVCSLPNTDLKYGFEILKKNLEFFRFFRFFRFFLDVFYIFLHFSDFLDFFGFFEIFFWCTRIS